METSVKERLKLFLRESQIRGTDFCANIGVSSGFIAGMRESIQPDKLKSIAIKYPTLNIGWLMTGQGEMIKQEANRNLENNASIIKGRGSELYLETTSGIKYFELSDNKFRMRVPLVPFNAYARYANESSATIEQEREAWDEVEFIVDKIGHGNYMGFEIKGDSMDDDSRRSFMQGDIVLARELDKIHWKDGLRYEKFPFWIIVLDNTILCKQIIEHNTTTGDITCHSLNPSPEYSDFTVNLSKVCRIFNIIQKVSTTF